jgi:group I intron endonuclease
MPFVYKITNKKNKKSYVGYTKRKDVYNRIREHFSPSVYEKINKPFYNAIKKHGKNSFEYEILFESCNEQETIDKEIEYIKIYGDYNLHEGGNIPPSQKGKTWNLTEETKQKMRKPKVPRTKEHSEKLSKSLIGKTPWNKGKSGLQSCPWKGMRKSPSMSTWKITKKDKEIITDNLILWCEQNNYITSTVKYHYYNKSLPYKDILKIEKVK